MPWGREAGQYFERLPLSNRVDNAIYYIHLLADYAQNAGQPLLNLLRDLISNTNGTATRR